MKVRKFHGGGVLSLIVILSMVLTPFTAFADTAEVPLMLTVEAAPLEFTVTESIQMSVIQGNSDLTITPVTVTNNGSEKLKVSQIEITAESGWSLVSSETDFSTSDSKGKLAFTLNSHNFSGGAYTPGDELSAGGSKEYQLAGKISSQADLMATGKVSDFVVTVEKAVNLIWFTIAGRSYQAEKGMTWREWCESSYNTGFLNYDDAHIYNKGPYPNRQVYDIEGGPVYSEKPIMDNYDYIYAHSVDIKDDLHIGFGNVIGIAYSNSEDYNIFFRDELSGTDAIALLESMNLDPNDMAAYFDDVLSDVNGLEGAYGSFVVEPFLFYTNSLETVEFCFGGFYETDEVTTFMYIPDNGLFDLQTNIIDYDRGIIEVINEYDDFKNYGYNCPYVLFVCCK